MTDKDETTSRALARAHIGGMRRALNLVKRHHGENDACYVHIKAVMLTAKADFTLKKRDEEMS